MKRASVIKSPKPELTYSDKHALGRLFKNNVPYDEILPVTLGRLRKKGLASHPSTDEEFRGIVYITDLGRETWRHLVQEYKDILKLARGKQEVSWKTEAAKKDWHARMTRLMDRGITTYDGHGGYTLTYDGWQKAKRIGYTGPIPRW